MNELKVLKTNFEGVYLIEPQLHKDNRGYFMESYNKLQFEQHGILNTFIQDNQSLSIDAGTIRGLHYQLAPFEQSKLVRVLNGEIFEVLIDLRKNSPTYKKWGSFHISAQNKKQLMIPKGFAHGFCTLVPNTEVLYKVDNYYSPKYDRGILWDDPELNIEWPVDKPILSEKDKNHPTFKEAEKEFLF